MLVGVDSPFTDIIAGASLSSAPFKSCTSAIVAKDILSLAGLNYSVARLYLMIFLFFLFHFGNKVRFIVIHFLFFFVLMMRRSCEECRPTIHIFFFPPLLNAQRAVVGRSGPITFPGIGPSVLCVREAGALGGNGGRKELKNEN
jgi:hypothetical protein